MTAPLLLTGGTGTLGRLMVARLSQAGHQVRVLSRHQRALADGVEVVTGDLTTGAGAAAAVQGTGIIVHCAGSAKGDDVKTRTLLQHAVRVGTPHLVYISVVGADRVPVVSGIDRAMFGYFAAKRAAERLIEQSGVPFTILRTTQFHDSMLMACRALARLPVIPAPRVRFQPVDTTEVADRLTELAAGKPAGLVAELGGPRIYPFADLIRTYLRATGRRRVLLPVRQPGRASRAFRDGANLTPEHAVGSRTWEEFLADPTTVGAAARGVSRPLG